MSSGAFPFPLIEAPRARALETWDSLRAEPDTTPVILGGSTKLAPMIEALEDADPEQVLDTAADMLHPDAWDAQREAEFQSLASMITGMSLDDMRQEDQDFEASLINAPWPEKSPENPGLMGLESDDANVSIARLPTKDPTEIPAYLNFGGWNENPAPQYHVAALRSWHERYGAVPVLMSSNVLELRVLRRPETRDEAMELALEHYHYCEDIVTQGVETIPNLAASLMVSDWWYFWWD